MTHRPNGQLIPNGGGDPIPLIRDVLTIGRRDSCDIPMPFPNVSGLHCELNFRDGLWHIRDRNSTNGIKVNGKRVQEKVLRPKDEISIGKRLYTIQYAVPAGVKLPEESEPEGLLGQSLLEKAGLEAPKEERKPSRKPARRPDQISVDDIVVRRKDEA
jgi:adenylate cyclase